MVIFHSKLLVYQRVYPINIPLNHYKIPWNPIQIPLNHYKLPDDQNFSPRFVYLEQAGATTVDGVRVRLAIRKYQRATNPGTVTVP